MCTHVHDHMWTTRELLFIGEIPQVQNPTWRGNSNASPYLSSLYRFKYTKDYCKLSEYTKYRTLQETRDAVRDKATVAPPCE